MEGSARRCPAGWWALRLPEGFVDDLSGRVLVSDVVGQYVSWDRKKTNAARGDFWACCPFHQERTPSFHVLDGKGFYHCFGCGAKGDAISFLRELLGLDFLAAVAVLAQAAGVEMPDGRALASSPQKNTQKRISHRRGVGDDLERAKARCRMAAEIWRASFTEGAVLMSYLEARGVDVSVLEATFSGLPPCLRFHPALPHRDQATGRVVHTGPAMVALMSTPDFTAGIHRTWITAVGRMCVDGEKLPKQWLGWTGRMNGCPVRLTMPRPLMVVGEGIETTLSVWSHLQAEHLAGRGDAWSAEAAVSLNALTGPAEPAVEEQRSRYTGRPLSSGIPDLSRWLWRAPDEVRHLLILGEGSKKDPQEAQRRGWCAQRRHLWRGDGSTRFCELKIPPGGWGSGDDFANVAVGDGHG